MKPPQVRPAAALTQPMSCTFHKAANQKHNVTAVPVDCTEGFHDAAEVLAVKADGRNEAKKLNDPRNREDEMTAAQRSLE